MKWTGRGTAKPWDGIFQDWVRRGRKEGVDPNDIGDREWNDPRDHIRRYYLPHIRPDSVVLELGPGSGRITRHLIGLCGEMILVDYSAAACEWLEQYLQGRGRFRVVHIREPQFPEVLASSVDVALAFGVFEHIGLDDMRWFLEEFHRVIKRGGKLIFNFDNLMTDEGLAWHKQLRGRPGDRHIFRFYHPDMVARLAGASGFHVAALRTTESRHAEIELNRP